MRVSRHSAERQGEQAKQAMVQAANEQKVLSDYWVRLDTLNEAEWSDFYRRVRIALLRCPASELAGLPDGRDAYIHEFFAEKMYFGRAQRMPETRNQTISGGALCFFFRNYLRDVLDGYRRMPILEERSGAAIPDDNEAPQIGGTSRPRPRRK